jgi:molecular chaperone DnaK
MRATGRLNPMQGKMAFASLGGCRAAAASSSASALFNRSAAMRSSFAGPVFSRRYTSTSDPLVMGIDLGTTNSCVAVIENGKPRVIDNVDTGYNTTPSMVAFTKDKATGQQTMLVGDPAKRQCVLNPRGTVYGVKRLIGRRFDSEEVAKIKKHVPYEIVKAANNTGDAWVSVGGKSYSPSQIGAFILQKCKESAEKHVGQTISKAVITVPAYFNDSQRQATKDAGAIAGLDVLRIINEPTAASLAYGFSEENSKERQRLAVFDLGGGTFDISILEIGDGMCQVVSTNGDTFLGGEDFDETVLQYLMNEFKKKEGVDLSKDVFAIQRLREGAEKAKKALDHMPNYEINLPFITRDKNFSYSLTKEKFNELIKPLVDRTIKPCQSALKDAGLDKVDNVILVGGMTRTPAVIEKVKEVFGLNPSKGVNPDEVVAMGAAIQGGVLSGKVNSLILLDVTPLSLGVSVKGDLFSRIIKRNSSIPCSNTQTYTTAADGQRQVVFDLLQGEREIASANHLLGQVTLPVMPAPKGIAKIDVTFNIDVNGIVHVTAKDPVLNKVATVQIQANSGLSQRDIDRMLKEAELQKERDQQIKELAEVKNEAETLIRSAETDYLHNDVVPEEDKETIRQAVSQLQTAMDGNSDELKTIYASLKDTILNVGAKLYQQGGASSSSSNDGHNHDNNNQETKQ